MKHYKSFFALMLAGALLLACAACGRARPTVGPAVGYYPEHDFYAPEATDCGHEVKSVASMELVSQKKPLVFFELLEFPKVEGIKVKLTYVDGSGEVVDAYDLRCCTYNSAWSNGDAGMEHNRGMFIFYPEAFTLAPGRQQIAMFYVDHKSSWSTDHGVGFIRGHFDSLHPENGYVDYYNRSDSPLLDAAYCMVEVYAQTGDEYIAEHNLFYALVTESGGGEAPEQWRSEDGILAHGLVKLLAQESGTYRIEVESGSFYEKYAGCGAFKCVAERPPNSEYYTETGYYAKLNANEPLFLNVGLQFENTPARVTMKRVPDGTVVFDELGS